MKFSVRTIYLNRYNYIQHRLQMVVFDDLRFFSRKKIISIRWRFKCDDFTNKSGQKLFTGFSVCESIYRRSKTRIYGSIPATTNSFWLNRFNSMEYNGNLFITSLLTVNNLNYHISIASNTHLSLFRHTYSISFRVDQYETLDHLHHMRRHHCQWSYRQRAMWSKNSKRRCWFNGFTLWADAKCWVSFFVVFNVPLGWSSARRTCPSRAQLTIL